MEQTNLDPFDSLLSLEDQYHTEGYSLGLADGARSGRIEGRIFGLEKGYEKFSELGRFNGRAAVWKGRMRASHAGEVADSEQRMAPLKGSQRLEKNIRRLEELTDPELFVTENSEEGVEEVEVRLKESKAKAMLISKTLGEDSGALDSAEGSGEDGRGEKGRVRLKNAGSGPEGGKGKGSGEMEDFTGGIPIAKRKD